MPTFNSISTRAFELARQDLRDLRVSYRNSKVTDVPTYKAFKLPREFLINALLIEEFGVEAVVAYEEQAKIWRQIDADGGEEKWLELVREGQPKYDDENTSHSLSLGLADSL